MMTRIDETISGIELIQLEPTDDVFSISMQMDQDKPSSKEDIIQKITHELASGS